MVKEAFKDKYLIDGFFIREFNVFPDKFDIKNLLPIQREFLMYLISAIPKKDDIKISLFYEKERNEIMEKTYDYEIETRPEVLKIVARSANITTEEYIKRQRKQLRDRDIEKLNEKFKVEEAEDNDRKKKIAKIQEYRNFSKKLQETDLQDIIDVKEI